MIESKESMRSTLGHSPDFGKAPMLVLGQQETPRLVLAPSTRAWAQPDPGTFCGDPLRETTSTTEFLASSVNIQFVRGNRGSDPSPP
jgi:hypothetical protein